MTKRHWLRHAALIVAVAPLLVASPVAQGPVTPVPGGTPDYFGPYSNYAVSPLPSGPINAITVTSGGFGYSAPTVTISDVYGVGPTVAATATVAGGVITAISMPAGIYVAPTVTITDATGSGATASATITPTAGGLHKFMDALPDLKALIAHPDTVTYPGSDYYEIELVDYTNWSFHADLAPTKLRGYHQTNFGTNPACVAPCTAADNTVAPPPLPSYLGPVIVATKDRPTRIKFTNNLAGGTAGDLFIPTDTTVMGAGNGPAAGTSYQQNRATLHLHGGLTPWVSDGTPHQWTVPASDIASATYPTGVSTQPVPDMPVPAGGSMTFYWPNQQSGRLMFYHDHAYGITRLNVYAGEAAGYLLRDDTEAALETAGVIPGLGDNIPLVIQDKAFVWGGAGTGTRATDPTWNWGAAPGSLWFPHVYMPNQNPWDMTGANGMGRWDYALWFWPPYTGLLTGAGSGEQPNPYKNNPGEPPFIPGIPNPSLVPEAFVDTPVINGKAYPFLNVDPKAYRFRILNAANDRFWNLSLFVAADKTTPTVSGTTGARLCTSGPSTNCTEVKMVPFNSTQNLLTPFPAHWYSPASAFSLDDRVGGVPDPTTVGPEMIQIGTEGGLLPAPVVIHNQPVNYTYDRRNIVVLSVQEKALFLGPAERADVIIDFSQFAGKTLILYSDAPAPVPAADPRNDYYTGSPDMTDIGGAPPTLPGYGPNTRTLMQIRVSGTANGAPFDLARLQNAFKPNNGIPGVPVEGAFAKAQDPILVAQDTYNSAYNGNFPSGVSYGGVPGAYARIQDNVMAFNTITGTTVTNFPIQSKAIQELFELEYGRMNATLGIELPFTNAGNQTTIPLGYAEPTTEILGDSVIVGVPAANDGTQLWKITHNGVDTHAIHFHLFNVQVINRVGWDGAVRPPDANELGWKETVRMNPLEDIIVAMRPTAPKLPFGIPDSHRLLNPILPAGPTPGIDTFDTLTGAKINVPNLMTDFGWEYVWHCHLLGHEENDMMRPLLFNFVNQLPVAPVLSSTGLGPVNLAWTDGTPGASPATLGDPRNEIGFRIERSNGTGAFVVASTAFALANATTYTDPVPNGQYQYRVVAYNAFGEAVSNTIVVSSGATPATPTLLTGTIATATSIALSWIDNSTNETSFAVWLSVNGGAATQIATVPRTAAQSTATGGTVTFTNTGRTAGNTYAYYVTAVNAAGPSGPSNTATVNFRVPNAPTALTAVRTVASPTTITLNWADNSNNETTFRLQSSTSSTFATSSTMTIPANATANATFVDNVGIVATTTYYYRVRAVNPIGNSAYSNIVTVPPAGPRFVQVAAATPLTAQTVAVPYPAAQTAGNLNIVVVGWNDTIRSVSSVSDSQGNVYSLAIGPTQGTALTQSIYYAITKAGANTVTVNFNGVAAWPDVRILEYAGVSILDRTAGAAGSGTLADSGLAAPTTAANELIFGANMTFTVTTGPGAGFASRIITGWKDIAEDRVVTAIGSYGATAPISPAGNWVMQVVTFK